MFLSEDDRCEKNFDINNNEITEVNEGHVYLSKSYMDANEINPGDRITIDIEGKSFDLIVDGIMKDAVFCDVHMMNTQRVVLNERDMRKIRNNPLFRNNGDLIYYIYYIDCDDTRAVDSLLADVEGFEFSGDKEMLKNLYVMDLMISMIMIVLSILLIAVCCIYSKGNWFFVAAPAVLFGLTVCFAPFIACRRPVNAYLKNRKGLAVMCADTVTFLLMMLGIGVYAYYPGIFAEMFCTSTLFLLMAWTLFLIIRYLPANGLVKAGICIASLSVMSYFANELLSLLSAKHLEDGAVLVSSQPSLALMLTCVGIGAVFTGIGLLVKWIGGKK